MPCSNGAISNPGLVRSRKLSLGSPGTHRKPRREMQDSAASGYPGDSMTRIPLQEHSYDERASLAANSLTTTAEPRPPGYEKGLTLAALNMYDAAIEEFRSVTRGEPGH